MPAARLVCQRLSSNFPYFRTPLANFLLSRPNSGEYGNCKTTTLLPSAKCTRPLFQGRTGCGGRPSGWHDIVTCQRLVVNKLHRLIIFVVAGIRMSFAQVLSPELVQHSLRHTAACFLTSTVTVDVKTNEVVLCWFEPFVMFDILLLCAVTMPHQIIPFTVPDSQINY